MLASTIYSEMVPLKKPLGVDIGVPLLLTQLHDKTPVGLSAKYCPSDGTCDDAEVAEVLKAPQYLVLLVADAVKTTNPRYMCG